MEPFRVIVEIAGSIIVALGGGGAIVVGLSSWLGKVWADRLMQKEKATHDRELEDFKVQALRKLEEQKAHFQEKIALYKEAITPVVEFITEYQRAGGKPPKDVCVAFEKKRLATSVQFGMFATVPACDAYNTLIDYILDVLDGKIQPSWSDLRNLAYKLLNEIRRDVGALGDVVYKGTR